MTSSPQAFIKQAKLDSGIGGTHEDRFFTTDFVLVNEDLLRGVLSRLTVCHF
ncbi:MAG: hypothetical protein L0387_16550 [Acidobacteria bacterium]|nr:hypothetical protein [Acidobacteriota bacterium]MCI0723353.1 hypothetical protein [Acidobacteriota bacterium]